MEDVDLLLDAADAKLVVIAKNYEATLIALRVREQTKPPGGKEFEQTSSSRGSIDCTAFIYHVCDGAYRRARFGLLEPK